MNERGTFEAKPLAQVEEIFASIRDQLTPRSTTADIRALVFAYLLGNKYLASEAEINNFVHTIELRVGNDTPFQGPRSQ